MKLLTPHSFFLTLTTVSLADNADNNVDLSENSSDEQRHERKKSISLEGSSRKNRKRISSTSLRDSFSSTIIHKLFETNPSFCVKQPTRRKVQFLVQLLVKVLLLLLTNFYFGRRVEH